MCSDKDCAAIIATIKQQVASVVAHLDTPLTSRNQHALDMIFAHAMDRAIGIHPDQSADRNDPQWP